MRVVRGGGDGVVSAVAGVVRGGGVVVFPTDTVYGIGCDPGKPAAVERIFALKGRPRTKPLALHLADVDALLALAAGNARAQALARAFLPGPLTVIVERPAAVAAEVAAGLPSIGLRVPAHDLCRAILRATGPLAATSANLSGLPAYGGGPVPAAFPAADLLVDDGATPFETESTVIDVSGTRARLVRPGAVATEQLERVLEIDLG